MIKYSDASNLEKTAGTTSTSRDPMSSCCKEMAKDANTGEYTCPCGNQVAVIRGDS
jgi:hypothetical protein